MHESIFDTVTQPHDIVLDNELLALLRKNTSTDSEHPQEKLNKELSPAVFSFIEKNTELTKNSCVGLLKTSTPFNIKHFPPCSGKKEGYELLINLKSINDTLKINDLFLATNEKLAKGGSFISCVETYQLRKKRILKKYWPGFNYVYYFFDYIFKRVFPKINYLDKLYFFITAGRNRAISGTEALGRVNYCGFEVTDTFTDDTHMYFAATKTKDIVCVEEKQYQIFLKLPRKGKNGKMINVLKLRTMFPYAEHLQEYIYEKNKLKSGGKFNNDFRISLLGHFFRKYFLDELPMLVNLLKGDLKLVGVRPLSNQYFNLYDKELQEQRLKHKPGLIPPFYADMPKTLEEIQASEKRYLNAHEKAPFKTDVKYFFLAFRNILFKKARSK